MEHPLLVKLTTAPTATVHRVSMEPIDVPAQTGQRAPAVVCVRSAAILADKGVGLIDATDVLVTVEGDWTQTVLVVLPDVPDPSQRTITTSDGDSAFLDEVKREAPHLFDLAKETITAIRASGVEGHLQKSKLGRWVNQPVNVFTLKAQPRVNNLHFTLYGNPSSYDAGDFLLKDQNSYSRGWVRDSTDVKLLANLAQHAHARRRG